MFVIKNKTYVIFNDYYVIEAISFLDLAAAFFAAPTYDPNYLQ